MILSEKIFFLRKKSGLSQEELAEKLGVSRQSVSKWETGQSIPDLDKTISISKFFDCSTDWLLNDDLDEEDDFGQSVATESKANIINIEFANKFMSFRKNASSKIALAIALCAIIPVPILLASYFANIGKLKENIASTSGVIGLLFIISIAVAIFIYYNFLGKKYDFLKSSSEFKLEYGVNGLIEKRRDEYKKSSLITNIIAVVLFILSAVPILFLSGIFTDTALEDFYGGIGVVITLFLVAIGCFLLVRNSFINDGFKMLLEEDDYSLDNKILNKKNEAVIGAYSGVYWLVVTAIFLLLMFVANLDNSWVIWPVSALIYPIGIIIIKSLCNK